MIVYCWRNLINGKEYIGSDVTDGDRQKRHLNCIEHNCSDCGGSSLLHKAIKSYGLENFEYFVLEAGFESLKSLREAEYEQIKERRTLAPGGYNLIDTDGLTEHVGHRQYENCDWPIDYLPPVIPRERIGFQTIVLRRSGNKKETPDWATDQKEIQRVLLQAFPKMNTDLKQRARAGRWARVVYLYYSANLTEREVAAEMELSLMIVKRLLVSIRRAAQGLQTNGSGLRGVRPRGGDRYSKIKDLNSRTP